MRLYLHLSDDERDQNPRHFAGRGAIDGSHWPGARSGENNHLQGAAAERTSPRAEYSPLHAPPEPINLRQAAWKRFLEREAPLYVCSCVIGSPRDGRLRADSPVG